MLILTRRLNEKIFLPGIDTAIEVVSIKPGAVRLGIEAPQDVTILREELPERPAGWGPIGSVPSGPNAEATLRRLNQFLQQRLDSAEETNRRLEQELQQLRYPVRGQPIEQPAQASVRAARALVVEDEQNERELLAGYLRMAGLEVDTATDGADALDYLYRHQRPDVVLLDMGLPRCDGPTTVREIRRQPSLADLRIYAVSGYRSDELNFGDKQAYIDRWYHKPLDPAALVRQLIQELGGAVGGERDASQRVSESAPVRCQDYSCSGRVDPHIQAWPRG